MLDPRQEKNKTTKKNYVRRKTKNNQTYEENYNNPKNNKEKLKLEEKLN